MLAIRCFFIYRGCHILNDIVTFLPDLPAHGGLESGQVVPGVGLLAVCDGKAGVVERVRALGVPVGAAHPTLDCRS